MASKREISNILLVSGNSSESVLEQQSRLHLQVFLISLYSLIMRSKRQCTHRKEGLHAVLSKYLLSSNMTFPPYLRIAGISLKNGFNICFNLTHVNYL